MQKTKRQQKIMSLIRARRIGTQQELTTLLERAGFVATQSSISRDLEELGVVKHNGHYTLPRAAEGAAAHGLLGLDAAGDCLVVAKCEPGHASAVAVETLTGLSRNAPLLPGADSYAFLDVDSTISRVYGYAKQGADYGYTRVRGLHPLLATISTPISRPNSWIRMFIASSFRSAG